MAVSLTFKRSNRDRVGEGVVEDLGKSLGCVLQRNGMQKHGTSQTVGDRRADHVLVDGDLAAGEGETNGFSDVKLGEESPTEST